MLLGVKSIDTMKASRDTNTWTNQNKIDHINAIIQYAPDITHITVDCYTNNTSYQSYAYVKEWADAIHNAGKKVWWRPAFIVSQGGAATLAEIYSAIVEGPTANPNWFADGDIFEMQPETNPFIGVLNGTAQDYADWNTWIRNSITSLTSLFSGMGKTIDCTYVSLTDGYLKAHALEDATVTAMGGKVCVDFYPMDAVDTPESRAANLISELGLINAQYPTANVVISELGTNNLRSIPDGEQEDVLARAFYKLRSVSYLTGMNYWGSYNTSTGGGYTQLFQTGSITLPRAALITLGQFYANREPISPNFVTRVGSWLMHKGARFKYIGFNSYTTQVDGLPQSTLAANFDAMKRHGCTVLRIWCFDRDNVRRDGNGNLQSTNNPTNVLGNFRYLATAAVGANILTNGGFESGLTGWSADPNYTLSTSGPHGGTNCVAVNCPGGFQNLTTLNDPTGITVLPNTDYTLQFWYKLAVTGNSQILNINAGSAYGTTLAAAFPGNTAGAYAQGSVTFNSGANTKVWIRIYNNNGTVTGSYDDFTLGVRTAPHLEWVESTLAHLDLVLDEARKKDIRIVLSLFDSNNYQGAAYPSKITYDNWANQIYGTNLNTGDNRTNTSTDFFRSPYPRQLLKDFVYGLANRVNTINGRLYKDDPTIMSWELGNETRFDSDQHEIGNVNTANAVSVGWIIDWIKDISSYIKSIDPNHLVTFGGCEFMPTKVFSPDGAHSFELGIDRGVAGDHVYVGSYNGIDYKQIAAQCPYVDIISFHSYPNQGLGSSDIHGYGYALGYVYSTRFEGYKAQIRAFIADTKALGRPVEFGEIGYAREDTGTTVGWPMYPRIYAFKNLFKEVFDNDGDGVLIWSLTAQGGGSFSVGLNETGTTGKGNYYWGTNENANDSDIMHEINARNTIMVDPGKRARSV